MSGNCPHCNAEWPAGATGCPKCGVLLDKWLKRRAHVPAGASRTPRWSRAALKAAAALAGVGVLAAAVGLLLGPVKGLPVAGDVHVDLEAGFAVTAPAGFSADWASEGSAASREGLRARFSGTYPGGFQPELSIAALPWPVIGVDYAHGEELYRDCFGRVRSSADGWTPASTRIVKVDMLDSLLVEGSGTRKAAEYSPDAEPAADYEVVSGGILVPGKDRSYLLSYVCDKRQEACPSAFQGMADSFRVLDRPRSLDLLKD